MANTARLERRTSRLADRLRAGQDLGIDMPGLTRKYERLAARLEARGGTAATIADADPQNYLDRLARGGAVQGRVAAQYANRLATNANLSEADRIAALARTRATDSIAETYNSFQPQIAAALGGPISSTSPSLQAAAARYLAERGTSTTRALSDIDMNLGNMRNDIRNQGRAFSTQLLTSIGDTVELLRAQAEQDRLSKQVMRGAVFSNPFSAVASAYGASLPAASSWGSGMMNNAGFLLQALGGGMGGARGQTTQAAPQSAYNGVGVPGSGMGSTYNQPWDVY